MSGFGLYRGSLRNNPEEIGQKVEKKLEEKKKGKESTINLIERFSPQPFTGPYKINYGKILGVGAFGIVYLAYKTQQPSRQYAAKVISKDSSNFKGESVAMETFFLNMFGEYDGFPRICKIIEDHNFYIFIMEKYDSDLGTQLKYHDSLEEAFVFELFEQIFRITKLMHSFKVAHGDLKPGNFLCRQEKEGKVNLAVCDFGGSQVCTRPVKRKIFTVKYSPPEVLKCEKEYDGMKADIWSLGVILYELATCKYPFGAKKEEICANVHSSQFLDHLNCNMEDERLSDLVFSMLRVNPEERISCGDIEKSSWFVKWSM